MKDTKASIFWTHWIPLTAPFYSPSYASRDGPSFWRKPKAPSKWNSACLDATPSTTFPAFARKSEAQSHSQPPGPTFSSYRWHAIHAADVPTDICHPQAAAGMHLISELLIDKMCQWFLLLHSLPSVLWRKARYLKTWAFLLVLVREGIYLEWSCISSKGQVFFCPWTLDSHSYSNLSP